MKMMEYGLMQWLGVLRSDKCWLLMYVLSGGAELCAVGWVLRLDERTKNGAYLKNATIIMEEKGVGNGIGFHRPIQTTSMIMMCYLSKMHWISLGRVLTTENNMPCYI
jgi:hypothetical protein